ncbi:branched-chain amino acid ABC transporter permease [Streptomyces sp. H10-C2]|uniref:branched-chain amino acid ABC transporter permease n=1 Tax=unclassified Streptomyces TaxID=2593676 RepID=UPI0024BB89C3|nr:MULTISPECIES: branched-chain amino acid ABC transporter permease [unclassified Streptomyces]MDJ0341023.1 branched-chain amino acid ABC transporter permease [Streptomyces sp. PH10-H1]MDJ0369745.1 branched-chain amino acid ABC transporter permease [Streptomyces sp. H10-C2]
MSSNGMMSEARARRSRLDPRWMRLGGWLVIAALLRLMTDTAQGTPTDHLLVLRSAFSSLALLWWLVTGAVVWAVLEAYRARGLGAEAAERTAGPRERWAKLWDRPLSKRLALLVVVVLAILVPPVLSEFYQRVLVDQVAVFVLLAVGLNVVVGWAGLLDLGYVAFFAIGSYTVAYFTGALPVKPGFTLNPFVVMPIAVAVCLIAGLLLGAPTLRLRGDYLAIVTLGFHEIVQLFIVNKNTWTGGNQGTGLIPHFSINILGIHYDWTLNSLPYWYLFLVMLALVVILFYRLENSKVGRTWAAIREDEVAAAANGVPTVKYKLMAFSIGASTSGFAGVLYASRFGYVNPASFPVVLSISVVSYVIFGGMGSIVGVIVGASVLTFLPAVFQEENLVNQQDITMWTGAILVVMMIFRSQGLIPSRRRKRELTLARAGVADADAMSEPVEGKM